MSSNWPSPGLGHASAYQVSGTPYVTSSADDECTASGNVVQISFPRVTRWFQIAVSGSDATSGNLRVGFSQNGVNGLGAVTGSVPTGEIQTNGTEKYVTPQPAPSAADQQNTHKNYFVVGPNAGGTAAGAGIVGAPSVRFELACTDLFLRSDTSAGACGFTIIAGLTGISRDQLSLTGSSGYHGIG